MKNEDFILSKTVNFLRFPLAVLVVLIHANYLKLSVGSNIFKYGYCSFPILNNIIYIFAGLFASAAVPLFFCISGYMFFSNLEKFDFKIYSNKIKRRGKSLFIPYLFWNLAVIILFWVAQTFVPGLMSGSKKLIVDYSLKDFVYAFWATKENGNPMCYQLWFIRDLMVTFVLSPAIFCFIKKMKWSFIVILLFMWINSFEVSIEGISFVALSFFSLGSFFAINDINFILFLEKHSSKIYVLFTIMLCLMVFIYNINMGTSIEKLNYLNKLMTLIEIPAFFSLALQCANKYNLSIKPISISSTFFLYCFHPRFSVLT